MSAEERPLLGVDTTLESASTLPGSFYVDPATFARVRERVLYPSWQLVGDGALVRELGQVLPFTLLEGVLDEPLMLVRDAESRLRCLSNVCTHRGNLLVDGPCKKTSFLCSYHGRRFDLDGKFRSMPEFEQAAHFPRAEDDLPGVALEALGPLSFACLRPSHSFSELTGDLQARMAWLPFDRFTFAPERSKEYTVRANWALYCDNYLEGFHIPYLHASLSSAVDFESYTTLLFPRSSVQIALAKKDGLAFDPPRGTPDHGRRVAAYYWWLYPNTLLNFYPWGLSVNVVRPTAIDQSRIAFLTYVWKPELLEQGAGSGLHEVEMEDEAVVEAVQRGVRSRLYTRGRFSPTREQGVHHFHRMLAAALA